MVGSQGGDDGLGIVEIDLGRGQHQRRGGVPRQLPTSEFPLGGLKEIRREPRLGGVRDREDMAGSEQKEPSREKVSSIIDRRPQWGGTVSGQVFRLSGQNRVPLPPAIMTREYS